MMRASSILSVLAAAALLAACGKKPAPEQPAPEPPAPAHEEAPPPPPPPAPNDDAERMKREAEARAKALRDELADLIHFEFDKADIRSTDQGILDRKATILAANSTVRLQIAGHCDERGSDEYNLALGNRRAASAKRYLTGKGVDEGRLDVVSYGKERPLDPGHSEDAWARNRRDEFAITAGGENLTAPK
jgi:peptidoglycan-associated lipoprotein